MKLDNFLKAIKIISANHTTEIIINNVKPNGQVSPVLESPTIHVINCCASVINDLKTAGFTLSIDKGKLCVEDYLM